MYMYIVILGSLESLVIGGVPDLWKSLVSIAATEPGAEVASHQQRPKIAGPGLALMAMGKQHWLTKSLKKDSALEIYHEIQWHQAI